MAIPAASPSLGLHAPPRVHTVWEVCQRVQHLLARDDLLPDVWVRGEVGNAKAAPSGHLYFTLKDGHAQASCVMWSGSRRLGFEVREGLSLIVRARADLYGARGQFQLVVQEAFPDGHGRLHLALEQLKAKLAAEGLFAEARKRPLPRMPRRIGLVTSLHGAALRDMLRILAARFPLAQVVVKPVRVQGDGAAMEVAAAIRLFNHVKGADVLIVGRGGGSLEDLWAFNEEPVARAIVASAIPVVSAVGHETDTTIADLCADVRAATPSNAAERTVPDQQELRERLGTQAARLHRRIARALGAADVQLRGLEVRAALRRPDRILEGWMQRLDDAAERLHASGDEALRDREDRLVRAAALLDSYSPLRTLQRGYAIATVAGRPATSVAQLPPGTRARVRVADGGVDVVVTDARN